MKLKLVRLNSIDGIEMPGILYEPEIRTNNDDNKPVWGMNYYGVTLDESFGEEAMANVLRPDLMKVGEDKNIIPVRGIAKFENNGYTYTFKTTGTIEKFDGIEQIYKKNNLIYELHCSGGMIV